MSAHQTPKPARMHSRRPRFRSGHRRRLLAVSGLDGTTIGALALSAGVALDELAPVRRSLEDAFMELTAPQRQGVGSALPAPAKIPT